MNTEAREIIDISLQSTLKHIQDGGNCDLCDTPMVKAYVPHEVTLRDVLLRVQRHPGYRCNPCGYFVYSKEGLLETFDIAVSHARRLDDQESTRIFSEASQRLKA